MARKSTDKTVQKFLDELQDSDAEKSRILQYLRKMIFAQFPKATERMMYGGIMFSLVDDFGGLFIRKQHVSLEFGHGIHMDDPQKLLEGTGKSRRHLKLRSLEDIKIKTVAFFVKQAIGGS